MGSKLTKSKKKTGEDGKTDNTEAPVQTDWSTSTWPRKKKPDFSDFGDQKSDKKSGTLGRKSRFGKGSTATLGNETKGGLERRPSFGKRIRASARNWASTRGLYKGPKAQQGNDSDSKPTNDISKTAVEGNKEKVELVYADEDQIVSDNKELDVGALVKEMVTESIIKKKLSDTSSQKVEAQIEDDGDKEDYEPVFVNHNDTGVVMSEVCNVEFEPAQLVETCDVIVTEVDTNVVIDKEEISVTEVVVQEVVDNNEIPEISINDDRQISEKIQDAAAHIPVNHEAMDAVEDDSNKTVENIRETSIDEDICAAVEDKIEGDTEILADNISEQVEADQKTSEGVEIKIDNISVLLEEVEKATQDDIQKSAQVVESESEHLNESFVVLDEVEKEAELESDVVEAQPDPTNTTKVSAGNEVTIPVLSEMEPHLEDLLSQRRNNIEENVPSDDLEREHKQSEVILEPQLEDLMQKRQNIIEENLPSDDLERESKPSEVILEPELEDLMLKRQNIIEENRPFEDLEKDEKTSEVILEPELEDLMAKRRNIIEENAAPIDLEREKKTSEIVLEPQLDDLLTKRRNIIDENQVSEAIEEIEDEVANSDQKDDEIIEETTIEEVNNKDETCVGEEKQSEDIDENEEANLKNKDDDQKSEIDSSSELKDEKVKIDIDENEEVSVNNLDDEADCIVEELVDDILNENINSIEAPAMCSESCAPYFHGKVQDQEDIAVEDEVEDNKNEEVQYIPVISRTTGAPVFNKKVSNEETNIEEESIDEDHNEENDEVEDNTSKEVQYIPVISRTTSAPVFNKKVSNEETNIEEEITDEEHNEENDEVEDNKTEEVKHIPVISRSTCAPNFHNSPKEEKHVESEKEKDCTSDPIDNEIVDAVVKNEEDELLEQKIKDLSGIIGDTLKLVQEQISETGDEIDEIEKSKIIDSDYSLTADNNNDGSEDGSDGERTDISTDEGIVASSDEEEMCKDAKQEKDKLSKNSEEITNSVE